MFVKGERLSTNFWSGEFQCKCGCGFGLQRGDVSLALVNGLEEVRAIVGQPLFIVYFNRETGTWMSGGSGCRCETHNRAIGGEEKSQHLLGKAADVWGPPVKDLVKAAEQVDVFRHGGLGRYDKQHFVHMDVRDGRARWVG